MVLKAVVLYYLGQSDCSASHRGQLTYLQIQTAQLLIGKKGK